MEQPGRIFMIDNGGKTDGRYQSLLEEHGYEVFATNNAYQLIRYAEELHPQLYVVDKNAEDVDAWQVLNYLSSNRYLDEAPAVMLNAESTQEMVKGASHYVSAKENGQMLVDIAVKHDLFLIGDEAYREFVYGGEKLQSFGEFAERASDNIIVIDTVSKRFSACGARVGCLISKNREFMSHAMKYCQTRLSVATLDQVACTALYSVGPAYFDAVREEYKKRRDTLCRKLREIPGVVFDVPGGAFYVMAALPVDDADKFQQWLLEEFDDAGETVMFAPGASMYATPGKGKNEVRMAYVIESHKIERAMDILKKAIEVYNAK